MSCPRCAEGCILPGDPKGAIQSGFAGAYLATPSNGPTESKRAVLLLTDVFGLPNKNCKLIADEVAEKLQCHVWIPDYFDGQPPFALDGMNMPTRPDEPVTTWMWLQFFVWRVLPRLKNLLWTNRASAVDARVTSFIALLKEKKGYEKLGIFGYCFGGTTAIRFAATDLIQSVVICHPGPFSLPQIQAIRVPASWVCAEVDAFMPDALKLQSEAELASRKDTDKFVEYEFVDYKGTTHGFAIRPDIRYPDIVEAQKRSVDQIAAWFDKTLLV
ncbi:alpha/beta-hydrolase [Coprinellus micaceus]|uniref:Alpha/beta-hydrolase n=1 Tax=Coprinellus micaceus TaxID=71717 RepID=A0A4Y7T945_COPMI|nr:alpha/beta-hydrolase [Coprinellus micaceus]